MIKIEHALIVQLLKEDVEDTIKKIHKDNSLMARIKSDISLQSLLESISREYFLEDYEEAYELLSELMDDLYC